MTRHDVKKSDAKWRQETGLQNSCQERGGLGKGGPPQPKTGGSGGQRPPVKTEKFSKCTSGGFFKNNRDFII